MANTQHRKEMPLYAEYNTFSVTADQLHKILRGRNPFKNDSPNYNRIGGRASYRLAQLKDGTWWVENYRYGAPLFAPDYWWKLPAVAGPRILKLKEFVDKEL